MKKKFTILGTLFMLMIMIARAQSPGVSLFLFAPDACANALGENGVSTNPDVFSMYYNAAKYAFLDNGLSTGLSYTKPMAFLIPDGGLASLAAAYKLNDRSALAGSLRYLDCGEITHVDNNGNFMETYRDMALAMEAAYSYRIGQYLSVGAAGRFIHSHSNFSTSSFSGDVSAYYKRPIDSLIDLSVGVSVTDIGPKIQSSFVDPDTKELMPTRLRLGSGLTFHLNPTNTLAVHAQCAYMFLPVNYSNRISLGGGVEYWYNNKYGLRVGYNHQTLSDLYMPQSKVALGAAFRYKRFSVNATYVRINASMRYWVFDLAYHFSGKQ